MLLSTRGGAIGILFRFGLHMVTDELDREVADALEAELFGEADADEEPRRLALELETKVRTKVRNHREGMGRLVSIVSFMIIELAT